MSLAARNNDHVFNLAGILLLLLGSSAVAQEPELIVEVDRQQVYLGESITYNLTLNHVDNPQQPDLKQFEDFTVDFNGQQSLNSSSITIINGRRSEVIRRGMLYQFRLTPKNPGEQTIPAPSVTIDGETLTGRPVPIHVIAPEEQDVVVLEATVDRDSVYPLQPFTVSLVIAVRQLPGDLAERSPLSVQGGDPPKLTVPWLEDEQLPEGLEPQESWRDILEPLVSGSSRRISDGFQINGIGSSSAFSFFERSRKAVFLPQSERVNRKNAAGEDTGYVEYRLQRTFVPQRVGSYRFGPCNVKGTFGTEFNGQSLDGAEIYAVAKPIMVKVNDVPLHGRPDSYVGAIGTFSVSSDITPRSASVGDPVTLSLTIHGEGTISEIRPPDIAAIDGLEQQFRIYESTQETVTNGKVFRWSLRPLEESVTEFPAIPVGYFDVDAGEYRELRAAAIPLEISAAKQLSSADVVAATDGNSRQPDETLKANDSGLFANHSSLSALRANKASLKTFMPIWGTMIVGYLGISFALKRSQRLRADPQILRRRSAAARASDSLQAVVAAAGEEANVSPDLLSKIITGLIADFQGLDEAGMTAADATSQLVDAGVDSNVVDRVTRFLDQCDAARYGGGRGDSGLVSECRSLIDDLSRELKQR